MIWHPRDEPEDGPSKEEAAFYDALADNESAVQLMGNEEVRFIASELVKTVLESEGFDWRKFQGRRIRNPVAVKRILKYYGSPGRGDQDRGPAGRGARYKIAA